MVNFSHRRPVFILVTLMLILASLSCNTILPESEVETPSSETSEKPDLVISVGQASMQVTGACLEEYGPITSRVCVENRGNAPSSTFLTATNDGTNWTVPGLGPSEATCFDTETDLSGALVTADVNNEVVESNEDNNTWTIPAPTPPILCTQEVEEIQPTDEPDVTYQGASFSFDDTLASSVTTETVPEQQDAAIEEWNTPEHFLFTFNGYSNGDTFWTPQIMVFFVDSYIDINPTASDTISRLEELLETTPSNPENIPLFPVFNAAQFMQAQVNYLRFQNGAGVRFLTQYGQAAWPINNVDMFYAFQGITDDGKYYISAIMPVSHPSLPIAESVTLDDAFAENFMNYVADIEEQLSAESADSFEPSLSILDAMIESLNVTGIN